MEFMFLRHKNIREDSREEGEHHCMGEEGEQHCMEGGRRAALYGGGRRAALYGGREENAGVHQKTLTHKDHRNHHRCKLHEDFYYSNMLGTPLSAHRPEKIPRTKKEHTFYIFLRGRFEQQGSHWCSK